MRAADWQSHDGAIRLYQGDCLEIMPQLTETVDAVICDLPYGTTSCKWDAVIPFEPLWTNFKRLVKTNGAIALTASQPFSSALVMSNPEMFRHEWVWIKNRGSNFANTVREPFKEHETVLVFSRGGWTYNKQMQNRTGGGIDRVKTPIKLETKSENYRKFDRVETKEFGAERVPSSWQKFNCETGLHPTQKPSTLMEYVARTYTNEGETVLDSTFGSGTTAIACINARRRFIGIERDPDYFNIAVRRITDHILGRTESLFL